MATPPFRCFAALEGELWANPSEVSILPFDNTVASKVALTIGRLQTMTSPASKVPSLNNLVRAATAHYCTRNR